MADSQGVMAFPTCKKGSSPGVLLGPQDQRPRISNECMTNVQIGVALGAICFFVFLRLGLTV